jgi:hypothetical protein
MATTDTQTESSMILAPDDDAQREPMATADDHTEAKPKKTRKKLASPPEPWANRMLRPVTVKLSIFSEDLELLEEYIEWRVETAQLPAEYELYERRRVGADFFFWTYCLLMNEQVRMSKARAYDHSEAGPKKKRRKLVDSTIPIILWYNWTGPLTTVKLTIDKSYHESFDRYVKSIIETEPKNAREVPHHRPEIEAKILHLTCRRLKRSRIVEMEESQNQGGNEETTV